MYKFLCNLKPDPFSRTCYYSLLSDHHYLVSNCCRRSQMNRDMRLALYFNFLRFKSDIGNNQRNICISLYGKMTAGVGLNTICSAFYKDSST